MFNNFLSNKLFTFLQLRFPPGDSCIPQLLSIIHETQSAFENNPTIDVRVVFLDISKDFDKILHKGLKFNVRFYGFEGALLSLLENYL